MKNELDNNMNSLNNDCFKTGKPEERWDAVREKYTTSAERYSADNLKILNDAYASEKRAELIGYKEAVYAGANIVDIGCGPGLDSLIMARMVGAKGKVIGIDIAEKMLLLAKSMANTLCITNVEFLCGLMENLPLDDCSADIVVCAGAINLSPQKDKVFASIYRILRSGGKLIIRDRLASADLPTEISENRDKWASCIGGAITMEKYLEIINRAGFINVKVLKTDKLSNNSPVYCGHVIALK